jgi:hypothetical protein
MCWRRDHDEVRRVLGEKLADGDTLADAIGKIRDTITGRGKE